MSDHASKPSLDRARRYHDAIAHVLLHEWDPIGVADMSGAADEYDSYVGQVYGFLIRHEPRHKLADYLWWAETEHMCLRGSRRHTEQIVDRLLQIRDEIEGADL